MSFNVTQFAGLIDRVLTLFGRGINDNIRSEDAIRLLFGTAAQESQLGTYLRQINGPALGVFQIEPDTELDIWKNWLVHRHTMADSIYNLSGVTWANPLALETNLAYQIIMARIHYLRVPEPLPHHGDVPAMANYWKAHYNTHLGKGTPEEWVRNFKRLWDANN